MPRIVLITNDGPHGRRMLHAIWRRGIRLDAVLYLVGSLGPTERRGHEARLAAWRVSATRTVRRFARFHALHRARYAERCARVIATGAMNSPRLLRDLRRLEPDWIVLGGGGILRPETLAMARAGVLNAHPALLPWVRGNGVLGASLQHGVALGATVHRVDAGIDTGAIVERRLLAVGPDDTDLAGLEDCCGQLAAEMMADAVAMILEGRAPPGKPQGERHPLFRWPDAEGAARHRALAAAGRAHALYQAWLPLAGGDARAVLPDDAVPPPVFTPAATATNAAAPRV